MPFYTKIKINMGKHWKIYSYVSVVLLTSELNEEMWKRGRQLRGVG
jgi:ribosomal protein L31E